MMFKKKIIRDKKEQITSNFINKIKYKFRYENEI